MREFYNIALVYFAPYSQYFWSLKKGIWIQCLIKKNIPTEITGYIQENKQADTLYDSQSFPFLKQVNILPKCILFS